MKLFFSIQLQEYYKTNPYTFNNGITLWYFYDQLGFFRRLIHFSFSLFNNQGLKFSDLLYVTKRSMANAVSNLTKNLEQVSEALSVSLIN